MIIKITRYRKTKETVDGSLTIDGIRLCDTAENAIHAIPAGHYTISVIKCKQHSRKMPVVILHKDILASCNECDLLDYCNFNTNMPVRCPQLCPGNGVYNRTDGAIIVGRYIAPGCLAHPKSAFDALYERIRKNAERGNTITLTIAEDYPHPHELTPFEMGTRALAQMGGRKTACERTEVKPLKHHKK